MRQFDLIERMRIGAKPRQVYKFCQPNGKQKKLKFQLDLQFQYEEQAESRKRKLAEFCCLSISQSLSPSPFIHSSFSPHSNSNHWPDQLRDKNLTIKQTQPKRRQIQVPESKPNVTSQEHVCI